jgi:AcrR family transcriptional regulator
MNRSEKSQPESGEATGGLALKPPTTRRRRRKTKGAGSADPRRRMIEAMLASIGEQGYGQTVVADVITRAVASRKTFYEHFEDKQACFLVLSDEIADDWLRRLEIAVQNAGDPQGAIEALVRELFELALQGPAELRVLAVELTAAGIAGMDRRERLLEQIADLIGEQLGGDSQAEALRARAIAGALFRILYVRARKGARVRRPRRGELTELVPQVADWILSYDFQPGADPVSFSTNGSMPPVPVGGRAPGTLSLNSRAVERRGLPRGDSNVSRSFVVHNQRERIIDALANLSAAKGYEATTIPQIVQEAAVSVQAFYEHFSGKEDVFLVAYEIGHRKGLAIVERAYEAQEDWSSAVEAGIEALLGFLASESSYAHLALVDALTASPKASEIADAGLKGYTSLLQPGLEASRNGNGHGLAPIAIEATASTLVELCFVYTATERARELPSLNRFATDVALRPFQSA